MTVLDHIVASLRAAKIYNKHDQAAPSVILWTDGDRRWQSVAARVSACFPRFFTLADEVGAADCGPSTWIRYQLSRPKGDDDSGAGDGDPNGRNEVPIIYLPGIFRQQFRSAGDFPEPVRHLYALQFQGQFWTQQNAKDWTPAALLASADGGLALDLAQDQSTLAALATQLGAVLDTSVSQLQGKRLETADFNGLAVADPAGMMLRWMSDPEAAESSWSAEQLAAFHGICGEDFNFNPQADGRIGAAEKLVAGGSAWEQVWSRYEEGPNHYPGLHDALGLVKPDDLFEKASPRLPENNRTAETKLRQSLNALDGQSLDNAKQSLQQLATEHRPRVGSVWAQLGEAPLADAVAHLGDMIRAIDAGFPGSDWSAIAENYLNSAWKVDAEARRSFAAVRNKDDMTAVSIVLRTVYLPWLTQQADRLTPLMASYPNPNPNPNNESARRLSVEPGTVYLFVDGLRADLANELCQLLDSSGLQPSVTSDWAARPTVTATAKPAWQPLAEKLAGGQLPEGYEPQLSSDGKKLSTAKFRQTVDQLGLSYFESANCGDPDGGGWTEVADFDSRGHKEGAKLAWRIKEELQVVRHRVSELLAAGWKKVVIVTDHGWLWLPGGLPKTELPAHLMASKWGRCAVAKDGAQHSLPTAPWYWGNEHHVVLAPGVSALKASTEYAHGGVTIQEALTVSITVSGGSGATLANVAIISLRWLGLRLAAEFEATPDAIAEIEVDVRTKAADASSSLFEDKTPRPVRADGKISMLIESEEHEGKAATLVVLHGGEVVCKQPVTIGEN